MTVPAAKPPADPHGARDTARHDLANAEAKLGQLQRERQTSLRLGDGLGRIREIDRQIAEAKSTVTILSDRITALDDECLKAARAGRESQRTAALSLIERKLKSRVKVARELDEAIKLVGRLYFELLDSQSFATDWPFTPPYPKFGDVDKTAIQKETGWALFSAGRPVSGVTALPGPSNNGLGITGISAKGIAGAVEQHNARLIELLQIVEIHQEAEEVA
jgi:hypothetical protein